MKAVRIHEYGNSSVLQYEECDVPTLADDEVLVRVVATSVNPVDWKIREGYLAKMLPRPLPWILGWDVSGVVEATGAKVTRFKPGDAVYSRPDLTRDGCYAEYVAIREAEVAFKPQSLSHLEAALLPLVGITAWESLITVAGISPGQRVLIHAGAGGVGHIAIQLAKWRGCHVITTGSAGNRALLESLGADEIIDYRAVPFKDVVHDVDVVFDTVGGQVQEDSWSVLNPGGMLVSITSRPAEERARAQGCRCGFVFIQPNAEILGQLAKLVDDGRVRPILGAEFRLDEMQQAHALSQSGRTRGKIGIRVGNASEA